jgi:integrase
MHNAFHVRYYTVIDGVRKQKSRKLCDKDRATGCGSPSAKAVRQLCEDFMRTINTDSTPEGVTLLSVVDFWNTIYLPFIEQNLKHSTVWGYKQVWNQHLKAHFGQSSLNDYKTATFSLFLTQLAKTLRPRTIAHVKFLASGLFAHAVAMGKCSTNPIRDARVLGKMLENGQTQSYTLEECEAVINALIDHPMCQLIMALAFFAGLRKGEIQGLMWEDYDGELLHIRRAFGRGQLGTPKTRKSVRTVPVIAPLKSLLGVWHRQSAKTHYSGWVFPSERGTAVSLDGVAGRIIRPALKAAEVPWKGYHACRRGLGTALRGLTGNSNAGRDVLGHSDERITQDHYEHALPEAVVRGMKLLEEKVSK